MALFRNFGVNHADGVTGLESLVWRTEPPPPRNAADFLELAENCTFLDRKLTSALNEPWMGTKLRAREKIKSQY
jgi:hypothetical protein